MTTMGVEPTFVVANVLIYANIPAAPENGAARARLDEFVESKTPLWISRQILREYLARLTRPQSFTNPLLLADVSVDNRCFQREFEIAKDSAAVTSQLLDLLGLVSIGGKQIHDANIVAKMLVYGVKRLLTHNLADFRRFSSWIEVVPLASAP